MAVAVHGIGVVNCYGDSEHEMEAAYHKGDPSLNPAFEIIDGVCRNKFRGATHTSDLTNYLAKRTLRRIDHYSRMALLGAGRAMKDAESSGFSKDDTGVIVATGYGALNTTFAFLDSYIEKGDKLAFPTHFSNSVHNAAAAHISTCYKMTGPSLTVSQFDMSFFSALITAKIWLDEKKVNHVLIGTSDEYCDVLGYCVHEFYQSLGKKRNMPYSTGEGAAFFMLSGEESSDTPGYGFIKDVFLGNSRHADIGAPEDSLVIISPDSLHACSDEEINILKEKLGSEVIIRSHNHYPTCSGEDTFFASKGEDFGSVCLIKIGHNGEWGRIVLSHD